MRATEPHACDGSVQNFRSRLQTRVWPTRWVAESVRTVHTVGGGVVAEVHRVATT